MAKDLPLRSEVKVEDTWKLEDMYQSKEAWEADVAECVRIGDEIAKFEGKVCESAKTLKEVLDLDTKVDWMLTFAYDYAARLHDQDTADTEHQAMSAKIFMTYSQVGAQTSFIAPEIVDLDDAVLEGFYKELPELEFYRKYIDEIRRLKAHRLSAELEKVIAMTSEMANTASDARGMLDNADMEFPEITDANGEKTRITHGRYVRFLESADRRVRKEAFEGLYSEYKKYLNTYA
ncbi:MAG: oligoendopeptidase F, partial [Lachnospiraceae bacterium]|nr:oligoendopeptidase F [Lachnospiraceae bacterium]